MSALSIAILSTAETMPEGWVVSPKDFLHVGSRFAVDQTFTRLTRDGKILRISRGIYVLPIKNEFGSRFPTNESVIKSIEARSGECIVESDATSANILGVTPNKSDVNILTTSGSSRTLRIGDRSIELKHGNRCQLAFGKRPVGMAVRALLWIKPDRVADSLELIHEKLDANEWSILHSSRSILPSWMACAVSKASSDCHY